MRLGIAWVQERYGTPMQGRCEGAKGARGGREGCMLHHVQPLPLQMYRVHEISLRPTPSGRCLTVLPLPPPHSLTRLGKAETFRRQPVATPKPERGAEPATLFRGRKAPSFALLHHLATQEYLEGCRGKLEGMSPDNAGTTGWVEYETFSLP